MTDKDINLGILIPTYGNSGTIVGVIDRIKSAISTYDCVNAIIIVDDGSTDDTEELLNGYLKSVCIDTEYFEKLSVVKHEHNRGKGAALLSGFDKASRLGCTHCLTIDADGQHFPEDIPAMIDAALKHPEAIVIGRRDLNADGMPSGNTFANKFSNFWFYIQTAHRLEDTQTGFRVYPLSQLRWRMLITSRYESELELMVYAAWHGTDFVSCPVRVYYPPAELRVSHFRPYYDFARITILNTLLCVGAIIYGYPSMLLRKLLLK